MDPFLVEDCFICSNSCLLKPGSKSNSNILTSLFGAKSFTLTCLPELSSHIYQNFWVSELEQLLIYIESAQKIFIFYGLSWIRQRTDIVVTDGNPDATSRPTFYMSMNIKQFIPRRNKSMLLAPALWLAYWVLLLSRIGQQLQENASRNNRTLAQELEQSLGIFQSNCQWSKSNGDQPAIVTRWWTYLVLGVACLPKKPAQPRSWYWTEQN